MKQRYSSLDLQVVARELNETLTSYRLSNIYDISSRIFLLKFALPESKHLLVVDSGFRAHLTTFARETSPSPSSFVQKLRKYLRTRRLSSVRQLGTDRILEFSFSDGLFKLYLEFFASGNVVLVDAEGTILTLLRLVTGEKIEYKPGIKYAPAGSSEEPGANTEDVVAVLENAVKDEPAAEAQEGEVQTGGGRKFKKKKKKASENTVKKALSSKYSSLSPTLIEHSLFETGVSGSTKIEEALANKSVIAKIVEALHNANKLVENLSKSLSVKGYIVAKDPSASKDKAETEGKEDEGERKTFQFGKSEGNVEEPQQRVQEDGYVYDDFHPFKPKHLEGRAGIKILEFEGFNKTVDEFFSSIESQKLTLRLAERENTAARKIAAVREEHQKRIDDLREVQDLNIRKAQAIEANSDRVEEAIAAVNSLVAQGMDWVSIDKLIEGEQKRGNPLAELIKLPLKLHDNKITLRLGEASWEDDESEEEEDDDSESENEDARKKNGTNWLKVDIDLSQSAWANARRYYDEKKVAAVKEVKTIQSSGKALKNTERKITHDLKKGLKKEKQLLKPVRNPIWFEKFYWFISSEGYLVIGSRDLQQNELILKRHFKKGDLFVHSDIDNAAMVIVKNDPLNPGNPIPPSTISQAGNFCVCSSKAWDSKQIISAWYVEYGQVSKKDQLGEPLGVGAFRIVGEKTYLPPATLVLGYGVMWLIDEESRQRRFGDVAGAGKVEAEVSGDHQALMESMDKLDVDVKAEPEIVEPDAGEGDLESRMESEVGRDESGAGDIDGEDAEENDVAEEESSEVDSSEVERNKGKGIVETVAVEDIVRQPEGHEGANTVEYGKASAKKQPSAKEKRDPKNGIASASSSIKEGKGQPRDSRSSHSQQQKQMPLPRGKKSKLKKAKQKYAEQDEEDRALALKLLGVAPKEDSEKPAEVSAKEKAEEEARQKQRRRDQHLKASARASASGKNEDESDEEQTEEKAAQQVKLLQSLVPELQPDDVVLDVLPVCLPWSSAAKLKFKVKMQPGIQKKGKAVKDILERWKIEGERKSNVDERMQDKEKFWPKEVELMKAIRLVEVVANVPVGLVKIHLPGRGDDKRKGGPKGKSGKKK